MNVVLSTWFACVFFKIGSGLIFLEEHGCGDSFDYDLIDKAFPMQYPFRDIFFFVAWLSFPERLTFGLLASCFEKLIRKGFFAALFLLLFAHFFLLFLVVELHQRLLELFLS